MDGPATLPSRPQSGDADIEPAPLTTNDEPPDHEDHDPRPGTSERRDDGTTPHLAGFHLAGRAGKVPREGRGGLMTARPGCDRPGGGEGG